METLMGKEQHVHTINCWYQAMNCSQTRHVHEESGCSWTKKDGWNCGRTEHVHLDALCTVRRHR